MSNLYEIRADYDKETIVVYQAYSDQIADAALREQQFVAPFSFRRMTWIKPSFLWLMYRSHWGQKNGQQRILAVRIKRSGWEKALQCGVLTHPEPGIYKNSKEWDSKFHNAEVHIQWDTERSLQGKALNHYSIQVGISRHLITEFVEDWIVEIKDVTSVANKIHALMKSGKMKNAKKSLPNERLYPISPEQGQHFIIG